ncbi:MAG: 4Fe-4S binding protein [Desulfarculus sp.]|nr:4Fe-4S binding protein [Desulfarculus sp.]
MAQELYQRLQKQLDQYSIGFPTTASGVEFEILRALFNEDDGELFSRMSPRLETPAELAQRLGREPGDLANQLESMANRGLLFRKLGTDGPRYAAIPFIHGLFEFQVKNLDPALAALMERYVQEADFDRAMQTSAGAFLRTIPVRRALPVEHHVAAYEDAAALLGQAGQIVVTECICRKQKQAVGKGCGKLPEACFMFGSMGQYYLDRGMGRRISLDEGLAILAQAAEAGLVTQPGTAQNPAGMCNCCGDCCGVLGSLRKHPKPASIVFTNHFARLDRDLCTGCEICLDRCQMDAITMADDGLAVLNPDRCIGCGLCVTTCPGEALSLVAKPDDLRADPPKTSADQMRYMAQRRGLL